MFELSPDLIKIDRTKNKQWLAWQHTTGPTVTRQIQDPLAVTHLEN